MAATRRRRAASWPFSLGKPAIRREMVATLAGTYRRSICYCNAVGGNDQLVFDGNSIAVNAVDLSVRIGSLRRGWLREHDRYHRVRFRVARDGFAEVVNLLGLIGFSALATLFAAISNIRGAGDHIIFLRKVVEGTAEGPGAPVIAGTVASGGSLRVRITAVGEQTLSPASCGWLPPHRLLPLAPRPLPTVQPQFCFTWQSRLA